MNIETPIRNFPVHQAPPYTEDRGDRRVRGDRIQGKVQVNHDWFEFKIDIFIVTIISIFTCNISLCLGVMETRGGLRLTPITDYFSPRLPCTKLSSQTSKLQGDITKNPPNN